MAAAWRSKWLDWKPEDEIISTFPETSPTKGNFDGFVGSKEGPRPETLTDMELMPNEVRAWDDALLLWTKARCAFREKSWGSVSSLYVDHVAYAHQTGGMFAPDRETFVAILMALGFQIQDSMVYGLILREDAEAAHWKQEPPKVMPRQKRGAR